MTLDNYFAPRAEIVISFRDWDNQKEYTFSPRIIELHWTKNNYRVADELHVTVDWTSGGVDPRFIKQGRCVMYMWDAFRYGEKPDNFEQFERFQGIMKTAERKVNGEQWQAEFYFQDYTCLFLEMKPFPTDGMPEWNDTLTEIWRKIRAYTGFRDRDSNKIISNCEHLDTIVFDPPELAGYTLGQIVPKRFHAISKPTPPERSDAWKVWLYCMDSLGLVARLDKTVLYITTTNEYYKEDEAPRLIWGQNILSLEEKADTHVSNKGVIGKAFDPLTGTQLESVWPLQDDPYIKKKKSVVKRATKAGADLTINDVSSEYIPYFFPGISDQSALDKVTRACFDNFSKQEIKGKLTTRKMTLPTVDGFYVDVLDLNAGDCIQIGVDSRAREIALSTDSLYDKIVKIRETCGYSADLARAVVETIAKNAFRHLIYHVETLEVSYGNGKFDVELGYHNRIYSENSDV